MGKVHSDAKSAMAMTVNSGRTKFTFEFQNGLQDDLNPYADAGSEGDFAEPLEPLESGCDEWERVTFAEAAVSGGGPLGKYEQPLVDMTMLWSSPEAPATILCQAPLKFRCALGGHVCKDPVYTPGGIL